MVVEEFFLYRWYDRYQAADNASGSTLADAGGSVLVGAGDIAVCGTAGDEATAKLLDSVSGTIFTLGDNVYPSGTTSEFSDCYASSWDQHKNRTLPSAGNREYETAKASGYFGYFGARAGAPGKGYYSYGRDSWHIIVLNSNCREVSCAEGSAQERWLGDDLATNPSACTLAYFHHPRFYSSRNNRSVAPFWGALYEAGAEVIVNGHAHNYERFAPQRPDGTRAGKRGIREFVVGTGGVGLTHLGDTRPNSQARKANTHGVLKLTLNLDSYDWKFVPVAGKTFTDSGSTSCH